MSQDPDYKKVYDQFWKPLIEKDGKLSMDALMRELFDYHLVLQEVPKVYDHISGGKFSKPHYKAKGMIAAADEWCAERVAEGIQDHMENMDRRRDED